MTGARGASNKRMQLTKHPHVVGGPASRASFIESRFAADPRALDR